ncbi:putative serine/threonine-protein kinase iksA [Vanrija pseudolonga]|uniref:Serine/threonine-protein kinase iksA n=1 Tax=Vanrija pseudolonga TaxID=143232 RepID=A0AAF0Y0K1_9TREE|nr:putative serine/threonine-protein kinase iksA [Vanrija pseudolonga]
MDNQSPSLSRSWTPIGETSHQLIVYHPPSHAIQVVPHPRRSSQSGVPSTSRLRLLSPEESASIAGDPPTSQPCCPLCGQDLPTELPTISQQADDSVQYDRDSEHGEAQYFRVLERAHELSRPGTPVSNSHQRISRSESSTFRNPSRDEIDPSDLPAMGYYQRFFKENRRLGIGAEGSVYLATHIIGGSALGTYAVKKIAVGTSKTYLVKMLREVHLLETLRHPNIIPYYHSWVDETQFSSFGPPIIALHVLMMYANAGNLDAFLLSRSHLNPSSSPLHADDVADTEDIDLLPKAERIKAFKRRRQSGVGGHQREYRGVLLLGLEEVVKLFSDVVEGLAFLHANSVLHLDLKCSNVLLHWEEGKVIPKALLSDFGTSEETLRGQRERTGHTGTMEYMAPETIVMDVNGHWRPSDSHADMWSLGVVLHKMIFLKTPYQFPEDLDALHNEIIAYPGFVPTEEVIQVCERRHIPRDLLLLLSRLLSRSPDQRPTAEKVRVALSKLGDRSLGSTLKGVFRGRRGQEGLQRSGNQKRVHESQTLRTVLALPSPVESVLTSRDPTPRFPKQRHPVREWTHSKNTRFALFVVKLWLTWGSKGILGIRL